MDPTGGNTVHDVAPSSPGGQNANSQSTRVELREPIGAIENGSPAMMQRLRAMAGKKITASGELLSSRRKPARRKPIARSHGNPAAVTEEASRLRRAAGDPTYPPSQRAAVEAKKRRGEIKSLRSKQEM